MIHLSTNGRYFWANSLSRFAATVLVILLTAICCSPSKADEPVRKDHPFRRIAIIASETVQDSGLADLVLLELSQQANLEPIEREDVASVLKELEFSSLGSKTNSDERLKLGRLLKADMLLLLNHKEARDRKQTAQIQAVLSDCTYGARLQAKHWRYQADQHEPLAKQISAVVPEVQARFPRGIEQIVCVNKLMCRNLVKEPNHYQVGFTKLIENGLLTFPGVAVVETDEARSIGQELSLTGADLEKRAVPLLIEGEFVFSRREKENEPTVRVNVRVTDGTDVKKTFDKKELSLAEVSQVLSQDVPQACVALTKNNQKTKPASVEQQFDALVRRADEFARLGYWGHAASLREAALLLKPGDGEQTIAVTAEYMRLFRYNDGRRSNLEKYGFNDGGEPLHVVATRVWRVMMKHVERAIHARQLSPVEADYLVRYVTYVQTSLGTPGIEPWRKNSPYLTKSQIRQWETSPPSAEIRDEQHAFFRRIYLEIAKLDPKIANGTLNRVQYVHRREIPKSRTDAWRVINWEAAMLLTVEKAIPSSKRPLYRGAMKVSDGYLINGSHHDYSRYYDTVYDLLTTVPLDAYRVRLDIRPELKIPSGWKGLEGLFQSNRENIRKLARRLEKTGRTDLTFIARRAMLQQDFDWMPKTNAGFDWKPGQKKQILKKHEEMLERTKALYHFVYSSGYRSPNPLPPRDPLMDLQHFANKLVKSYQSVQAIPDNTEKDPRQVPRLVVRQPKTPCRVRAVPIEGVDRRLADYIVNGNERFDILVSKRQIHYMKTKGDAQPVFELEQWPVGHQIDGQIRPRDDGNSITETAWDGRYLWVGTNLTGFYLLDDQGKQVARWQPAKGEAPLYNGLPYFCTLSEGRCLVLGFDCQEKDHFQAWFALFEYRDGKAQKPRIIHRALKPVDEKDAVDQMFLPTWISRWQDPRDPGKPKWLIGRHSNEVRYKNWLHRPLIVDLTTLEVSVCPWKFPPLHHARVADEMMTISPTGKIAYPNDRGLSFIEPPTDDSDRWTMTAPHHNGRPNELVQIGDDVYFESYTRMWHTRLPDMKEVELYDPIGLQSGAHRLDHSIHYGLVGHRGRTRNIVLLDEAPQDERLQQFYPRVPVHLREKQDKAITALRALGAKIGTMSLNRGEAFAVNIDANWQGGQEGFKHLVAIYDLAGLCIKQTPVTAETMQLIGRLRRLERLVLYETGLTDADIAPVANLTQLERLRLEGTIGGMEFTDAAFEHIQGLPIEDLKIFGKGFTEKAIDQAFSIRTMRFLGLYRTSVTKEVAKKRQEKLPRERFIRGY